MAAVIFCQSEEIIITDGEVTGEVYWRGRTLNITVQTDLVTPKKIPETITVGNSRLITFAEGRKAHCFRCDQKGHIRAECEPSQKVKEAEKQRKEEKKQMEEKKSDEEVVERPNGGTKRKRERAEGKGKMKKGDEKKIDKQDVVFVAVRRCETFIHSKLTVTWKTKGLEMNYSSDLRKYEIDLKTYNTIKNKYLNDVPIAEMRGVTEENSQYLNGIYTQ